MYLVLYLSFDAVSTLVQFLLCPNLLHDTSPAMCLITLNWILWNSTKLFTKHKVKVRFCRVPIGGISLKCTWKSCSVRRYIDGAF